MAANAAMGCWKTYAEARAWLLLCHMQDNAKDRSVTESSEETAMGDTSVTKVNSAHSPKGAMGQKYLASGIHVAMRLWEAEAAGEPKPPTQRDYETVGYVISGRAELHLEGQMVLLAPGDSWVVPRGSTHTYRILEPFTAIEATSPPAHAHARDER
jgi:quercetin dioxygenase-like cupin family protein